MLYINPNSSNFMKVWREGEVLHDLTDPTLWTDLDVSEDHVPTIIKVSALSALMHGAVNQQRKVTALPYIVHPVMVARMFASIRPQDVNRIMACLLHDVIEDVPLVVFETMCPELKISQTVEVIDAKAQLLTQLLRECGIGADDCAQIVHTVLSMTDPLTISDGNRSYRKTQEVIRLGQQEDRDKIAKLCDVIANTKDICKNMPDFAKVYVIEKAQLMQHPPFKKGISETWVYKFAEQNLVE